MKTIIVVRHAKSSWADMGQPDHDRPLNKRGLRDAPIMAKMLRNAGHLPEVIISSTANRAQQTAEYFKNMYLDAEYHTTKRLYHAPESMYLDISTEQDDEIGTIMLCGHNPGITYLANSIEGGAEIDNVPTCGILVIESDVDSWQMIHTSNCRLTSFLYPKMFV